MHRSNNFGRAQSILFATIKYRQQIRVDIFFL